MGLPCVLTRVGVMQIALRREKPSGQTLPIQQGVSISSSEDDQDEVQPSRADEIEALFPAPHSYDRPASVSRLQLDCLCSSFDKYHFFLWAIHLHSPRQNSQLCPTLTRSIGISSLLLLHGFW